MADNISAVVKDGVLQTSTASSLSLSTETSKSTSQLDKDAFLQLLVAQMKYQDPLEPTENTEYISQLATFSQLEEMQNMTASSTLQRASGLVGESVILKVTNNSTGGTEYVTGQVDYVVYENNKAFLSVSDSLYSIDDLYEVIDPTYQEAYDLARKFISTLSNLPKPEYLTKDYISSVETLRTVYDGMNAYQKSFISEDVLKKLTSYEEKVKELKLTNL